MEISKGKYRHYKNGKLYEVIDVVCNADNNVPGDPLNFPYVLYRTLYGDFSLWVRPLAQFNELLEHEGKQVRRFAFVE